MEWTDYENGTGALSTDDIYAGGCILTTMISADELVRKNLPPVRFLVDGLLPQGLTLIASPPKYGKSWLVLDLCLSVAAGKPFLGRATERCTCLYLALEDSEARLRTRILKLMGEEPVPEKLHLSTLSPVLGNGLIEELTAAAKMYADLNLVVIDTFQMVRSPSGSRDVYARDYADMSALKQFADEYGISVVLVHHLRKAGASGDPFERISGTNGIFGAADVSLVLTRDKRSDETTTLSVTGRDVDSDDLELRFDKASCRWTVLASAAESARTRYENDPVVKTIRRLLDTGGGKWEGTAGQLLKAGQALGYGRIAPTAQKLGFELRTIIPQLTQYDSVEHDMSRTNTGNRIHKFSSRENDEENVWQEANELIPPF